MRKSVLIIACGALAREINALRKTHAWSHVHLRCLDPLLHNRPALIPDRLRAAIREHRDRFERIFVAYADCGTGGAIDRLCAEEDVERLPGAHCYQLFAGEDRFAAMATAEPGTFYLTDFLVRHFDRLVIEALGLDEHPELRDAYFGHYRRLVYLAQTDDTALLQDARDAAARLALEFEHVHCGYGDLETELRGRLSTSHDDQKNPRLLA